MIRKRTEAIRNKLLLQFERVSRKFKPSKSPKEVNNSDIQIALFQYGVSGLTPTEASFTKSEYGETSHEWIADKLTRLTVQEMQIVSMFYFEGKTFYLIDKHFKKSVGWAKYHNELILEKLRKG